MFCLMLYIKGYLYLNREKTIKLLFLEIARIIVLYIPVRPIYSKCSKISNPYSFSSQRK